MTQESGPVDVLAFVRKALFKASVPCLFGAPMSDYEDLDALAAVFQLYDKGTHTIFRRLRLFNHSSYLLL